MPLTGWHQPFAQHAAAGGGAGAGKAGETGPYLNQPQKSVPGTKERKPLHHYRSSPADEYDMEVHSISRSPALRFRLCPIAPSASLRADEQPSLPSGHPAGVGGEVTDLHSSARYTGIRQLSSEWPRLAGCEMAALKRQL